MARRSRIITGIMDPTATTRLANNGLGPSIVPKGIGTISSRRRPKKLTRPITIGRDIRRGTF